MASGGKALDVAEEGHERGRNHQADPRNRPEAPNGRRLFGQDLELTLGHLDVVGEGLDLLARRGEDGAQDLGLTPREFSSGLRRRLGRISKRGDSYLRMLLIQGARSVLCHAKKAKQHDRLRTWALALEKRTRHNTAAVALANKLARIAWAVWKHDKDYVSQVELAA